MKGIAHVAIDPGIASDVKTERVAQALRRDRYWVAGHFPAFLGRVAENCPDGDLSGVSDELLDDWAGGVKGWGRSVREHFCGVDGVLEAWWKYNGRALAKLQRDRDRKAGDADEDNAPEPARKSRGHSAEKTRKNIGKSGGDSTEPARKRRGHSTPITVTVTDTVTEEPPPPRASALAAVEQALPPGALDPLRRLLRGSHNPDGIADDLARLLGVHPDGMLTGPGLRPVPPDIVGRSLTDLANSERPQWNPGYFRGMLRRAIEHGAADLADTPSTLSEGLYSDA